MNPGGEEGAGGKTVRYRVKQTNFGQRMKDLSLSRDIKF